jgi:hypothetical protein
MFLKLTVKAYMMHVQCFACCQLALSPLATTSTTTKPAVQCYTQQYHGQKNNDKTHRHKNIWPPELHINKIKYE